VLAEKGGYEDALKEIESIEKVIRKDKFERDEIYLDKASPLKTSSNFTRKRFEKIVRIAKEYIFAGDVIQVVLSQRLKASYSGDPFRIYRALRVINPSPYMFYLDLHDFQIIGSSPEILVRVEGREIEVKPIAGTRPRGKTRDEDLKLENELVNSEKERAEHIMLVDLGRNDVGRVSLPGSVKVTDLMVVERYSHVMHLVSSVKGILRDDVDMFSAFVSAFPAGTVTGAPKIRAMEIIDELENERRGIYAGAIGYFDYSGNMDMAIAIRTLVKLGRDVYIQAGAGIVADSEPSAEYEETLSKARALLRAVEMAGKK
jgi:anthranilate synthase component 1